MQNMCQEWVEQETTEIMVWTLFLSYSLLAKLDRVAIFTIGNVLEDFKIDVK